MPTSPLYSPLLDFAPSFRWGGREWTAQDAAAFKRKMGKRYGKWARKHPTAAKVFDPVENQIYSEFSPQLMAIDRERRARQDYYGRMMRDLSGFAGGLAPLLSGIPGMVQTPYDSAAATMMQGATGYGNQLNADQAAVAAADNSLLGAIDSPAVIQGGDAGGVLAGYAGWIPSTMLTEQGAAHANRAKNFPKEAALQAQAMAKDLMDDAKTEDAQFSDEVLGVLSGLPGYRSKLVADQQAAQYAQYESEREYAMKQAALAFSMGKEKDYQYWKKKAHELDMMQERRYSNKDRGLDINGQPLPGYRVNPKTGRVEKIPTAKSGKKANPAQVREDMSKDVVKFYTEVEKVDPARPYAPATTVKEPWTYRKAYDTLWAKYKGTMPANRLRRAINEILKAAGITRKASSPTSPQSPDRQN